MQVHYDWRLARILNDDGVVIDEILWNSSKSISSVAKRLFELKKGRLSNEAKILFDRFDNVKIHPQGHLDDPNWPEYSNEERELFEKALINMAKLGVAESSGNIDRRMDMLVSSANEIRSAWTTSESRCIEWIGLFLTELNLEIKRKNIIETVAFCNTIQEVATSLETVSPLHTPAHNEWSTMKKHCESVIGLSNRMSDHEDSIRLLALEYIPSLSALLGPLGASKLVVLAGSRERLARMPSGSLQVLGADAAMAAHRNGAPPPKHGSVLFSMPQVSKSPRWVRGKVARYIAGKASIAVRIDHFDGKPWGESEIEEIFKEVKTIIDKFPNPPKRK